MWLHAHREWPSQTVNRHQTQTYDILTQIAADTQKGVDALKVGKGGKRLKTDKVIYIRLKVVGTIDEGWVRLPRLP